MNLLNLTTRQQNIWSSLASNFKEAEGAMNKMQNSGGALTSAYETYMNTTQAHLDQLKASFTDLSKSIFDSESTKEILDFGSGIIQFLSNLIDKFGALSVAIAGVGIYKFIKNFDKP